MPSTLPPHICRIRYASPHMHPHSSPTMLPCHRCVVLLALIFGGSAEFITSSSSSSTAEAGGDPHEGADAGGAPYYLLDPAAFSAVLGDDQEWALSNIPLFEAANATLQQVYYFRWRSFKSHIHPTTPARADGIDWVVTEVRARLLRPTRSPRLLAAHP